MNINGTLLGKSILILALLIGGLCYYLGKRKTDNPLLTAFWGVVLCLFPPLALIYTGMLILKPNLPDNRS